VRKNKAHVIHADRNCRAWSEIRIQHCKSVIDLVITFKIYNSSDLEPEKKKKKENEEE
jgi:hypothetical protein